LKALFKSLLILAFNLELILALLSKERSNPTASDGGSLGWTAFGNTYGPTDEHKGFLNRVKIQLKKVKKQLNPIVNATIPSLRKELVKTGAPWIEGQGLIQD